MPASLGYRVMIPLSSFSLWPHDSSVCAFQAEPSRHQYKMLQCLGFVKVGGGWGAEVGEGEKEKGVICFSQAKQWQRDCLQCCHRGYILLLSGINIGRYQNNTTTAAWMEDVETTDSYSVYQVPF